MAPTIKPEFFPFNPEQDGFEEEEFDSGNGASLKSMVHRHDTELALHELRMKHLESNVSKIEQHTSELPLIKQCLHDMNKNVESCIERFNEHEDKQVDYEQKATEMASSLKVKTGVVWWVIITVLLGGMIGKFVLPLIGL